MCCARPAPPRRPPLLAAALAASCALGGCLADNPRYCADDAACAARGADKPLCHPLGHFCYGGCASDAECQDPARPGYSARTPRCERRTRHCAGASSTADGGVARRPAGAACDAPAQCASGVCVGDVCCAEACDGPCRTCATGACRPKPAGTACAAPRCAAGVLAQQACLTDGTCALRETSCGGYACDAAGAACRAGCSGGVGCVAGFECRDEVCQAQLPDGEPCGANDFACASKHCVDGVCCASARCDDCFRCDAPGAAGRCQPRAAGPAPAGQCPGSDAACGAGQCSGQGCAYAAAGTACGPAACAGSGPYTARTPSCDGQGTCDSAAEQSCGFARCVAGACLAGCAGHGDCLPTSLCDRGAAHAQAGRGRCVDPAEIIAAAPGTLVAAIGQTSAAQPYVRVPAGTHAVSATVVGRPARLVGAGADPQAVVLTAATSGVPVLRVEGLGALALQGLTLQGATSGAPAVVCSGGSALQLVETRVAQNAHLGVDAAACDVTLRRSRLLLNSGGGARLVGGQLVLADNLVASNGAPALSSVGGLWLDPTGGAATCVNNTVANNVAKAGVAAGVQCAAPLLLANAIVWGNPAGGACSFAASNVEGDAASPPNLSADPLFVDPAGGDYTLQPGSPSIDTGDPGAAGVGALDLAGSPRVQGAAIDQGAFER